MILKTNWAKLNEIGPYNVPVINATDVYPILTEYGVEKGISNITIDYSYTSVKKLYKIDDGEWKNYDGPIKLDANKTIYAKGIDKNGKETINVSKEIIIPKDALRAEAYDGDESTSVTSGIIYVDKAMVGKYFSTGIKLSGSRNVQKFSFIDENNKTISTQNITCIYGYPNCINMTDKSLLIPEGTVKMILKTEFAKLNEIGPYNAPTINYTEVYPILTEYGIVSEFSDITIDYSYTSIKKLYKIDDGEWQEYKDKKIKLNIGETIYAKGIDKNGKETPISEYKSVLATDALDPKAYDGNKSTYIIVGGGSPSKYRKMHISPEMWGQNIEVLTSVYGSVAQLNEAKEILNSTNVSTGYNSSKMFEIQIVEDTKILEFRGGSSSNSLTVIEIYPSPISTQSEQKKSKKMIVSDNNSKEETITIPNFVDSPTINVSDANRYTSSKEITISYPSGGYENQYSLDGENWLNYTGLFTIDKETTVLARSMSNGNVISSSSYQITKIDNVKPTISLDDIPNEINLGDDYKLPTDYSFYNNKSGGSIKCLLDDTEEVTSTKDIIAGRHKIICSATTGSGIITTVEKNINVVDNSKQQEEKNDSNQDERPEESVKEGEVSEETKKIDEENKTEEFSTNSN